MLIRQGWRSDRLRCTCEVEAEVPVVGRKPKRSVSHLGATCLGPRMKSFGSVLSRAAPPACDLWWGQALWLWSLCTVSSGIRKNKFAMSSPPETNPNWAVSKQQLGHFRSSQAAGGSRTTSRWQLAVTFPTYRKKTIHNPPCENT